MKRITFTFGVFVIVGISGCIGWGDYMKFPPASTSSYIWFKQGISETRKNEDISDCKSSIEKILTPVVPGDYSYATKARHIVEYCMLSKGYTFTDALPPNGGVSYCSKTYNGSGPACKSIGK
jgi:hypothetical protein